MHCGPVPPGNMPHRLAFIGSHAMPHRPQFLNDVSLRPSVVPAGATRFEHTLLQHC